MKTKILLLIIACLIISGCADTVVVPHELKEVGFLYGFWHGIILPFSFIGSLFKDNIAIYAVYNNGALYDLGFALGTGALITMK